jgi:hypothetical protein
MVRRRPPAAARAASESGSGWFWAGCAGVVIASQDDLTRRCGVRWRCEAERLARSVSMEG